MVSLMYMDCLPVQSQYIHEYILEQPKKKNPKLKRVSSFQFRGIQFVCGSRAESLPVLCEHSTYLLVWIAFSFERETENGQQWTNTKFNTKNRKIEEVTNRKIVLTPYHTQYQPIPSIITDIRACIPLYDFSVRKAALFPSFHLPARLADIISKRKIWCITNTIYLSVRIAETSSLCGAEKGYHIAA